MSHYFSEVQDVKSAKKIINYEIKNDKNDAIDIKLFRYIEYQIFKSFCLSDD